MELNCDGLIDKLKEFNKRDLIILLIPLLIFSFYLYVFNPGIATYDTFNQIHQIASGQFTNWHPFFHTFINMLCLKVYPNPLSIGIFQILVFSTMWMIICKYNRDDTSKSNKTFILQAFITLIICLIPINALYSITIWKDILFSYFLMFLCFLVYILMDKKGTVDYKFIILLSLVMAFISQLRGNGLYVIIIALIIYSVYLFLKKNTKMSILLPTLTIIFILLIASLNIAYDVQDNEKDALMTKTAHMLADYDLNLEIEDGDRQKIHELIDENKTDENYEPTGSDRIYAITNKTAFENNKDTYLGLALKYSMANPLHCSKYLLDSSPMAWDIVRDSDWFGRPYYMAEDADRLQRDFEYYYSIHNYTATYDYENISYINWGTHLFNTLNSLALYIEGNVILDTLFDSPALYMYLSIIVLIGIYAITRSKEMLLIYIPNLLNIIVVFLSTPIQDNRYLYANLLVCYLLIIILIGLIQKSDKNLK
ncbi:MAG: hypothetical protein IJQ68_01800 [Methanobrevibacter sp.]|uniref:DUF6020 family protein n=1 Tax=Methanobrevibacter sp. TaxID=66852 RepID=UPI0025F7D8F3|nr:DUF6020 family protein [Methanobrevibacter sp.]MBR0270714.1 hypothetical protein [Methanobrevibacter sp.]